MKTRKALAKRFKITKTGKVMRRATGQNHYKAKKTSKKIRQKRKWVTVHPTLAKQLRKIM